MKLRILLFGLIAALWASPQAPVVRQLGCSASTGSGSAYACTITGVASFSYVSGTHYWLQADVDSAGPVTFQFNGAASPSVTKMQGSVLTPLVAGDIHAGQWVDTIFDGTRLQMQSQLGNANYVAPFTPVAFAASATTLAITYPSSVVDARALIVQCWYGTTTASTASLSPSAFSYTGTVSGGTVTFSPATSGAGACVAANSTGTIGPVGATGAQGPGTFGGCALKTANYTLTSSDSGTCIELNGASLTLTIPATWHAAFQARILNENAAPFFVNTNSLKINGSTTYGPVPGCGTPMQGCPLMALYADGDGINYNTTSGPPGPAGSIFFSSVNPTGAGPSNTATETSVIPTPNSGSQTLPGASWQNGTQVTLTAQGIYNTPASTSDTATVTAYCGATPIAATPAFNVSALGASVSNQQWDLSAYIGATTVGTTGFLTNTAVNFRTTAGTLHSFAMVNTSTVAYTLSSSCALDLKVKFSGATSGESILGTNAQASLSGVGPVGPVGATGITGVPGPTGLTGTGVGPAYAAGQGFLQIGAGCDYCVSGTPSSANAGIIIQFQVIGGVPFPLKTLQVVAGTNTGSTFSQAIYSDSSGSCGTLIAQTATATLPSSGLGVGLAFGSTQSLSPGFYWWAITGDGTFGLFETGSINYGPLGMNEANSSGTVVHPRSGTINAISTGSGGSLVFNNSCGSINLSTFHSPIVWGFPG
jgi:hypothetical protein